tara:strand:+ start:263 stop:610 length:348 start_codon:yes stop_codon:yes gene_type:complete
MNILIYEDVLKIILDSENEQTKKEKIKNLKSKKVIKIMENSVKIYKETNAMLRWNLIKNEIEELLKKENSHKTQEERNTIVNKLMTVIQLYVDKESHEKKLEKTEKTEKTKKILF